MKSEASYLASAAGAVAAITIVLYEAWLMPFFQPIFAGRTEFARVVFYALYAGLVVGSAAVLATRTDIRRKVVPLAIVAVAALAATALHPIGLVTRAYIIAVCMGAAAIVLTLGSAPGAVLRLVAAVTALNAALCFVDLLFADGFTTTVGRAAGLAINPNVAAAAILLGAAASHRAVPRRVHLSFFVLTAGAIAVTLSRSTILAAAAAAIVPAVVEMRRRAPRQRPMWTSLEGVQPAVFVALVLGSCVGAATITNHRLRPVVHAVVADSLSFVDALGKAHDAVAVMAQSATPAPAPASPAAAGQSADPAANAAVPSTTPTGPPSTADAPRLAALDTRLADEGKRNTISARTLFLERAMLTYRDNGFFGMGLEDAQRLVPHNTFLLFALAFGHPGWLIPLAIVALTLYNVRDPLDLPLAIAAAGTMATSHDILITPSLLLPIAIGIAAILSRDLETPQGARVDRAIVAAAVAGVVLFLLGCLLIVRAVPSLTVERLSPASILGYKGAYTARLPTQTFPGLFVPAVAGFPEDTATFLHVDSRPLARVAWNATAFPPVGPGEYAVQDGMMFFAPPDAGDPRVSGHVIELGLPHKVGGPFYALVATLAAWCVGLIVWFERRGVRRAPVVV